MFSTMKTRLLPFVSAVLAVSAAAAAGADGPFRFPRATPESQGIPSAAVSALVDRLQAEGDMAHGYMLIRHGKVVAEGWWAPYGPEIPHALHSISKAFTSMAIGYAVEDRKMTLSDRVNWFFPEYVPSNQTQHAKELRVRDLMQMASGHKDDPLNHARATASENWAKSFYEVPVVNPPGLFFRYMTGNSCMLAQIHRKVTGAADMIDYLRPRLFDKLDIADLTWERQPDGTVFGGGGFYLKAEDLAKVAQLLLQGGVWKGERLLPLWWVKQATSCQTPYGQVMDPVLALHVGVKDATGAHDPENDWQQGYGFQMWMGRHETFRLCGAWGQIGVVMPSEDMVFVVNAGGNGSNMLSVNAFYDTILPALSARPLPENPTALAALRAKSSALAITLPVRAATPSAETLAAAGRRYALAENKRGLSGVRLDLARGALEFENAFGRQTLLVGDGCWKTCSVSTGKPSAKPWKSFLKKAQLVGAAGAWTAPDTYRIEVCYLHHAQHLTLQLRFADGRLELTLDNPLSGVRSEKVASARN